MSKPFLALPRHCGNREAAGILASCVYLLWHSAADTVSSAVLVENKAQTPDRQARENIRPRSRRVTVLLLLLGLTLLCGGLSAYKLLRLPLAGRQRGAPSASVVPGPELSGSPDELQPTQVTAPSPDPKSVAFVVAQRVKPPPVPSDTGTSAVVPASAGALDSLDLIRRLSQIATNQLRITPERAAELKQNLKELVTQGTNAVAAIRQFLERNQDISFDETTGANFVGYSSLRAGLFDALKQIGGPEATDTFVKTLRATADPAEIALIAQHLEELAPGQFRQEAVVAARETLEQIAKGQIQAQEVAPLFRVLQSFGDATVAPDLQQTMKQWQYYAALALVGLPEGQGIPALVQGMHDPTQFTADQASFALQMLAQAASHHPPAATALVDQTRLNQVPDKAWAKIAEGLAGDQYQLTKPDPVGGQSGVTFVPGLKTYHIESGNQNYYSIPFNPAQAPDQADQRRALIDQLLAATQNPIAIDALQRARAKLK